MSLPGRRRLWWREEENQEGEEPQTRVTSSVEDAPFVTIGVDPTPLLRRALEGVPLGGEETVLPDATTFGATAYPAVVPVAEEPGYHPEHRYRDRRFFDYGLGESEAVGLVGQHCGNMSSGCIVQSLVRYAGKM